MTWLHLVRRMIFLLVVLFCLLALPMFFIGKLIPPGQQVAFMYSRAANVTGEDWDVMLLDTRYGLIMPLTNGELNERFPSWSPDGKQLVYHADPEANWLFDLYIMDADGRNQRRIGDITDRPEVQYFSRGGVVYGTGVPGGDTVQSIVFTNRDYDEAIGVWSPDGSKLAFHSGVRNATDYLTYIYDLETGESIRILDGPGDVIFPAWSPDGTQLAFAASMNEPVDLSSMPPGAVPPIMPMSIYVLDVTGDLSDKEANKANLIRLTDDIQDVHSPAWSPDGKQIAYVVDDSIEENIYVMNADGSNKRQLTPTGTGTNWQPEWLPDGSGIMFTSDRAGDFDLYIMDADGSNVRRLTDEPGDEQAPSWRP